MSGQEGAVIRFLRRLRPIRRPAGGSFARIHSQESCRCYQTSPNTTTHTKEERDG